MRLYFVMAAAIILITSMHGQNHFSLDEKTGSRMLLGTCTRSVFSDTSFSPWFNAEYDAYVPNDFVINQLQGKLTDIHITIIMGTWCSDSKTQVPDFYKLLDLLNFPENSVEIICVDRKKSGFANELDGLNIEKVPTIIFYRNKKEIGRIIETPVTSLEKDILSFI